MIFARQLMFVLHFHPMKGNVQLNQLPARWSFDLASTMGLDSCLGGGHDFNAGS